MAKKFKLQLNLPKISPTFYLVAFILLALGVGFAAYKKGLINSGLFKTIGEMTSPAAEVVQVPQKVKVLQSPVSFVRDGKTSSLNEGLDQDLKEGDRIVTGSIGIASLIYTSGTIVRLAPTTEVVFSGNNGVFQSVGKIYVRFRKLLGVQEDFEVETTDSIAAVRGTAFASVVKPKTAQRIFVTDHEVEVTPKTTQGLKMSNLAKIVKAGEQAEVVAAKGTLNIGLQKLTQDESEWLDFNKKSDEDPTRSFINLYRSLTLVKSSPTSTPGTSGTPKSTTAPLSVIGSMPAAGYTKSSVTTSVGTFSLACYGANKGSVRMLTDSASDSTCTDNCPVMNLADYAVRNGGIAAMNGMYFCPADYPSCSGKVNSFDTLFFNSRTRNYMNSENNVYSNIPFVGMNADHSVSFVGSSSQWGRDTGIIGGTAGNPMLMQGSNYALNEAVLDDKQRNVKSNRGAIALEGDMLYLCITGGATVIDEAKVFQTLGADYAINVDGGGSSALWVQGSYKYGPGRQIPTAIILAP